MHHIIASKLAKRHHSTIRVGLALLMLHKPPPAFGRLLESPTTSVKPSKHSGSAAQTGNNVDFLHLAHVVVDKDKDCFVQFATPSLISASGQSKSVLVKSKILQAVSHVVLCSFT